MSASIIASFLSFLLTGFLTFFIVSINVNLNMDIKLAIFFALFANAFYFFYMEALTELKPAIKKRLKVIHISQWFIRIINQTILFSLWFLLEINLLMFSVGLVLLYFLFIIWDIISKEMINNMKLFIIDIIGAILSIVFFILTFFVISPTSFTNEDVKGVIIQPSVLSSLHFWWTSCLWFFILIPIVGIVFTKFELFEKKYWSRSRLS